MPLPTLLVRAAPQPLHPVEWARVAVLPPPGVPVAQAVGGSLHLLPAPDEPEPLGLPEQLALEPVSVSQALRLPEQLALPAGPAAEPGALAVPAASLPLRHQAPDLGQTPRRGLLYLPVVSLLLPFLASICLWLAHAFHGFT